MKTKNKSRKNIEFEQGARGVWQITMGDYDQNDHEFFHMSHHLSFPPNLISFLFSDNVSPSLFLESFIIKEKNYRLNNYFTHFITFQRLTLAEFQYRRGYLQVNLTLTCLMLN